MKARILLVDDEPAILLSLKAILEMDGLEVDTAGSTPEALQKMQNGVFHAVITDMRMETDTAGLDVIGAARQQPYRPATAILTAYPRVSAECAAQSLLLIKPFRIPELLRQIETLLVEREDHKHAGAAPDR